jgi:hypothetical protein
MKKKQEITNCEYCNAIIYLESPPPKCHYERGRIYIEGNVLLSDKVIEKNEDKNSHSKDISGYYCDANCLVCQLKKILHITKARLDG